MKAKKITYDQIKSLLISSLPSCPTDKSTLGGAGYDTAMMRSAFDHLPLNIITQLNLLIDDIYAAPADSISAVMQTGISDGHTLANLFEDLQNGNAAVYIKVDGKSLAREILEIKEAIRALGGEI